jgi:hypothetical protein
MSYFLEPAYVANVMESTLDLAACAVRGSERQLFCVADRSVTKRRAQTYTCIVNTTQEL